MKYSIAEEVFERIEEDNLIKARQQVSLGNYAEAESIGVLTLIKSGIMTQLNLMGLDIWEQLRTPKTVEEIAHMVSKDYGISYEDCYGDIKSFISDLAEKGFLIHE